MGRAGFTVAPVATIPFFEQPGASPFGLLYADASSAASLPSANAVTTTYNASDTGTNEAEYGGVGLDVATVTEYSASGSTATNWGTRYRIVAEAGPGNAGLLYAIDLNRSGTPPPAPAKSQLSSDTISGKVLCSIPPAVFDNYSAVSQSWLVFHAKGPDQNCGTLDDQYVGVQLSMTSSTPSLALAQLQPFEALYDSAGTAITGYLAINHPQVCTTAAGCTTVCPSGSVTVPDGAPECPVPLQKLDTSFGTPTTLATLQGEGLDVAGGDFLSLGMTAGNVWLYWDSTGIYALNLSSATPTPTAVVALKSGDTVAGRAVIDGTIAYVAVNNGAGSYIVRVDTSSNTATSTSPDASAAAGITLVGVTTNNLVYVVNDGSEIKSVVKVDLSGAAKLTTLTATQHIDSLMGVGASTAPVAFLVGDTVYFTVADTSSMAGAFAKQAFYTTFNGSGVPTTTAVSSTVSAVIGVVAPSSIPTTGPYQNVGALVVTNGANFAGPTGVEAAFANGTPATAGAVSLYGTGGTLTNMIGTLSSMNPAYSRSLMSPITGVALANGPVQAGMPALLELYGKDGTGANAVDLAAYTTDGATIPLTQISGFDQ